MTEPAASEPFFTRGRVILSAAVLALALAGLAFGFLAWESAPPVKVTLRRNADGSFGIRDRAMLHLTNLSGRESFTTYNDCFDLVPAHFVSRSPTGEVVWRNQPPGPPTRNYTLAPHSELTLKVQLPDDGRTGRLAIGFLPPQRTRPKFFEQARSLWYRVRYRGNPPWRGRLEWVEMDAEIQCPLRHADGSLDSLRVIASSERLR